MAGSYNHIVTDAGNLRSNESFANMIENLGDAYEMTEELFGMIWYLADGLNDLIKLAGESQPYSHEMGVKLLVEDARLNYTKGLEISKQIHRVVPDRRRD